jgi:hypothetical protein
MSDRRRALFVAALGFLSLDTSHSCVPPPLAALHAWLDPWSGISHIAVGTHRLGCDVSLKKLCDGRSTRLTTHSAWILPFCAIPCAIGSGSEAGGAGFGVTRW